MGCPTDNHPTPAWLLPRSLCLRGYAVMSWLTLAAPPALMQQGLNAKVQCVWLGCGLFTTCQFRLELLSTTGTTAALLAWQQLLLAKKQMTSEL